MFRLPLFPLPSVLFPGAELPLHIFEPRYRQMIGYCIEHDRRFGIIYHDPDRHGPYRFEPGRVGCVALIKQFQPLPDGRSMVMTVGTERFEVRNAIDSNALYYQALVGEYADRGDEPTDLPRLRSRTEQVVRRAAEVMSEGEANFPPIREDRDVSFQLARWIHIDAGWHQELLELRSEAERLDKLATLVLPVVDESIGDGDAA
jgi:Lon protease-like protein